MWRNSAVKCSNLSGFALCQTVQQRCLCLAQCNFLNQKWRQTKGLPLNPNASGVLTDGQDYSFLDGRPTPYGVAQKERILQQKEIAAKILALTADIDFAVDRYEKLKAKEENRKQEIIGNKLKPKGIELLKNKK